MSVKITYKSKINGKVKYLTTSIDKHGGRDQAMTYLRELKAKKVIEEREQLKTIPEVKEESKKEEIKEETKDENEEHNFIDRPIETTPQMEEIIRGLKYSPFKLEVDPNETGSTITIFGSSKSYKTTLLKRILKRYYAGDDLITVLSAFNIHSPIYKDLPSNIIKTDSYSSTLVKAMHRINKKTDNKYPFIVVLDDIIDEKNDKNLENLFLTLRNAKISTIILLQHVTLMKSTSRANSNIFIFRKFNSPKVIQNYVMEQFLGGFYPFTDLKMKDKVNLYMKITNEHDFFVLDPLNNKLTLHQEPEKDI